MTRSRSVIGVAFVATLLAPVLLAGLTPGAVAQTTGGQGEPLWAEWWHPAWHLRIPVNATPFVQNPLNHSGGSENFTADGLRDYPVQTYLDLTDAALQAGWATAKGAITSFTFDVNSIRVVEYDSLGPYGRPVPAMNQRPDGIPYEFIPTRLDVDHSLTYNASTNAIGTLTWLAPGLTTGPRYFFVYFDVLQNGKKSPPVFTPEETAGVRALGWMGRGHHLVGTTLMPLGAAKNHLTVYPEYLNTSIQVLVYKDGPHQPPVPIGDCPPVNVNGTAYRCTLPGPLVFRVVASKPVTATLYGEGSGAAVKDALMPIPSLTGTSAGTRFRFVAHGGVEPKLVIGSTPGGASYSIEPAPNAPVGTNRIDGSISWSDAKVVSLRTGAEYVFTSTRPVTLHLMGSGLHQFPSTSGAPLGRNVTFSATREMSVLSPTGGALKVYNDAAGQIIDGSFPSQNRGNEFHSTIPAGTYLATLSPAAQVMAGSKVQSFVALPGGNHARDFELLVPPGAQGFVVPYYNNTIFTLRTLATGANAAEVRTGTLSVDGYRGEKTFLPEGHYRLNTTRPVAVFLVRDGDNAYGLPLAGRLVPMQSTVGPLEFWGNGVSMRAEETLLFIRPDEPAIFEFTLVNTGRQMNGGPLMDNYTVERAFLDPALASKWEATLTFTTVDRLLTDQVAGLSMTVAPMAGTEVSTGDLVEVQVTATSKGNPNLKTSFVAAAKVVVILDFRFTFDDGRVTQTKNAVKGTNVTYFLHINNTGTSDDTVLLDSFAPPIAASQGWTWRLFDLLPDGTERPVTKVTVPKGQERVVRVNVTAPESAAVRLDLKIIGKSENNSLAVHEVQAFALLNVDLRILLEPLEGSQRGVLPGGYVRFPVRLSNLGNFTTTVTLTIPDNDPPGFTGLLEIPVGTSGAVRAVRNATFQVFSQASGESTVLFHLNVTAPQGELAGKLASFRVLAAASVLGAQSEAVQSLVLTAAVRLNHKIDAAPETRDVAPGRATPVPLLLQNNANGEERIALSPLFAPPGWTVSVPSEPLVVARNKSDRLTVTFTPPATAPPGPTRVVLRATFGDEETRNVSINLTVLEHKEIAATANPLDLVGSPGGTVRAPITLVNRGNRPEAVPLALVPPTGWRVLEGGDVTLLLAPNESRIVPVVLQVPTTAVPGIHALQVLSGTTPVANLAMRVGTLDLAIASVDRPGGDLTEGRTVTYSAHVRNVGDLPARDVVVALFVDGKRVSDGRVEVIPVGETTVIPLAWTVTGGAKEMRIVVDPDGAFVDSDNANNAETVSAAEQGGFLGTPGPGAVLLVALLAFLALATGRRARRDGP